MSQITASDTTGTLAIPAATPGTLTPAEIAHFIRHGHVTVRQAFPAEDARRMLDAAWAAFAARGIVRDDRTTWPEKYVVPPALRDDAVFDRIASPRFIGAVDDLVGVGNWELPTKGFGLLKVNFPERTTLPWDLSACGWHWDNAPSNTHGGLLAFIHIGETVPGGGGTLMASGSPRVFAHRFAERGLKHGRKRVHTRDLMKDHPWFMRLFAGGDQAALIAECMGRATIDDDGHALRVVESTGMPGDVTLCHSTIYHSGNLNRAHVPRIMRFCPLGLKTEWPIAGTPLAACVLPLA